MLEALARDGKVEGTVGVTQLVAESYDVDPGSLAEIDAYVLTSTREEPSDFPIHVIGPDLDGSAVSDQLLIG